MIFVVLKFVTYAICFVTPLWLLLAVFFNLFTPFNHPRVYTWLKGVILMLVFHFIYTF